jgi:hypothetical protein
VCWDGGVAGDEERKRKNEANFWLSDLFLMGPEEFWLTIFGWPGGVRFVICGDGSWMGRVLVCRWLGVPVVIEF